MVIYSTYCCVDFCFFYSPVGINYETTIASLNTLKKKGKVKANDSWPIKYTALPKKPGRWDDGQEIMDHFDRLTRENRELTAEINRLRGELNESRRKLARLAQRIVRQDIFGNH